MFGLEGFGGGKTQKSEMAAPEVRQALMGKMEQVAEMHRAAGHEVSSDDVRHATSALLAEAATQGEQYTMEKVEAIDVAKFEEMLSKGQPGQPVVTGTGEVVGVSHNPLEAKQIMREHAEENREAA